MTKDSTKAERLEVTAANHGRRLWSKHDRMEWLQRSQVTYAPLWYRLGALAMATHRENGHSPFEPGELASTLIAPNKQTGEIGPAPDSTLRRNITRAVDYGMLDPMSCARCLVVPRGVTGGLVGKRDDLCHAPHYESAKRPA